jgi:hypothetical protein
MGGRCEDVPSVPQKLRPRHPVGGVSAPDQAEEVEGPRALRIIVTGSRDWPDTPYGRSVISFTSARYIAVPGAVVVHGGCPTGADKIMDDLCKQYSVKTEVHRADWGQHGKAAGPIRNQEMVDTGADVVLAYPLGLSRGTQDCMARAYAAGIQVVVFNLYDSRRDYVVDEKKVEVPRTGL